jgi:hypothetical protein
MREKFFTSFQEETTSEVQAYIAGCYSNELSAETFKPLRPTVTFTPSYRLLGRRVDWDMYYVWQVYEMHTRFQSENLNGRDHFIYIYNMQESAADNCQPMW